MTTEERMMEVAKLRLRFRMNNRLRLESLAMLSKLFREHQEPIGDELLSSIVFAVPEELVGEAGDASGLTATILVNPPPHHIIMRHKNPPPHPPKKNPPSHPPQGVKAGKKNRPPSHPPQAAKAAKRNRPPSHPPVRKA